MAASPAQIAANRRNAAKSTGPRTEEGKEASRRNALKHGLAGRGVVVPDEVEQELARRVATFGAKLAPAGDVVAAVLVQQLAMASIRAEWAFRHEKALAAERMRQAGDRYMETRRTTAAEFMAALAADPATIRRRLIAAPEGIDLLVERLEALRAKANPQASVVWDDAEGAELDRCLGWNSQNGMKSRVGLLTRAILYDHWVGLDPAEFAGLTGAARVGWAVGQIHATITAEIARLEAHRETLDPARVERGRAEAAERELLDLGAAGTALRRYAAAAERSTAKLLKELRIRQYQARCQAVAAPEAATLLESAAAEMPAMKEVRDELGSYRPAPRWRDADAATASVIVDPNSSFVPFTVGREPPRAAPPLP